MKAEERKELETNKLADSIGRMFEKAKQGPSRNTIIVTSVLVLAVVLFYTWRYFRNKSLQNEAAAIRATFSSQVAAGIPHWQEKTSPRLRACARWR